MAELRLTTIDNPYNPFTEYDAWYNCDEAYGYHTIGYIARLIPNADELSDEELDVAYNKAISDIFRLNLCGRYYLGTKKDIDMLIKQVGGG